MKALGLCFHPEFHTDERISTHLIDGAPKCKQFPRRDKHASLLEDVTRKTCLAQHGGNRNSQFLQLHIDAGMPNVTLEVRAIEGGVNY